LRIFGKPTGLPPVLLLSLLEIPVGLVEAVDRGPRRLIVYLQVASNKSGMYSLSMRWVRPGASRINPVMQHLRLGPSHPRPC
jgi:hypothetical protein